jgi:hypothetical protein
MQHRTALDEKGADLADEIQALLSEHMPKETADAVWDKVEELQHNVFQQSDMNDRRLFRALMGFIPEHEGEVHAAFAGTIFSGHRCDVADFYKWAGEVEWTEPPERIRKIMESLD